MKIDGIKLPSDWRELIEELVDGSNLMLDDHSLQDALKEAGYASTSVFRRGAITGTEKLKEWWEIHKNDQPATYPSTFEEVWAKEIYPTLALGYRLIFTETYESGDKISARMAWDARGRAGQDIE